MERSRQDIEKDFYEKQALESLGQLDEITLVFENDAVLKYPATRFAVEQLGDLNNKVILDYGCGFGVNAVVLARLGAEIFGFDIAEANVQATLKCASANNVRNKVHAAQMAAEELKYADNQFDAVFGTAILHHVDLKRAADSLYRVMKPGAKASFVEPLGENPILEFGRKHLPYPNKDRTPTEKPMTYHDIQTFGAAFSSTETHEMQFVEMLGRFFRNPGFRRFCRRIDKVVLSSFPLFRRFCRVVVINYTK